MKIKMLMTVLVSFFTLSLSLSTFAETAVIVHPSNGDSFDQNTISRIFLGKSKKFPGGASVIPVNLDDSDATRANFDSSILGKDSGQLKAYWAKLVFTGKASPPKSVANVAEAKALVSSNPNTIAYIPADQVDGTVKSVFTF